MKPSGLTWISAAIEHTERALGQMRNAQNLTDRNAAIAFLRVAADELRLATNNLGDSVFSLCRGENGGTQ